MTGQPCKQCGRYTLLSIGGEFCSWLCSRDFDNREVRNGHMAFECPERLSVRRISDSGERYMHGSCGMPKPYGHHQTHPVIETDGDQIKITVHPSPYRETTYTATMVQTLLDLESSSYSYGGERELTFKVRNVVREDRKVHADPHLTEHPEHDFKLCVCGCSTCRLPDTSRGSTCTCEECSCA